MSLPPSLRKYAGIGSRETPSDVLAYIEGFARDWAKAGVLLRSGGAKGADTAFEKGCDAVKGPKEIFRAEDATRKAMECAERFHPQWDYLNPYARRLHARNSLIVLGADLDDPVDQVICWTPRGVKIGGTAQALRIAEHYEIPIVNLGDERFGFDN